MRWFFVLGFAVLLYTDGAAQTPSRWTLSAGPEWSGFGYRLWGMRVRANYDLLRPDRPVRLQLEAGGLWGPSQSYFQTYEVVGGYGYGQNQTVDLVFGMSASLSPLPRARFSPFVTVGLLARQQWTHGWGVFSDSTGYSSGSTTPRTWTYGDIVVPLGLGMRARLFGRSFQFEYRRLAGARSMTLGTRLPF